MTFVYPAASEDKALLDSLQRIFISCYFDDSYSGLSPANAVKNYEESYIESYKEDVRIYARDRDPHDNGELYPSYYEIDSNEITFNKGGLLSFQVTQTNYKGGAASYDFHRNFVIDVKTFQLISEDDIFNEGYEKALNTVFRDSLLKLKKVKNISELDNLGYFGLDEMVPNGNFLLDDKGVTYIFNKGEYSSLKTEPIQLYIPYSDITPLIKEGSPISKFVSM